MWKWTSRRKKDARNHGKKNQDIKKQRIKCKNWTNKEAKYERKKKTQKEKKRNERMKKEKEINWSK